MLSTACATSSSREACGSRPDQGIQRFVLIRVSSLEAELAATGLAEAAVRSALIRLLTRCTRFGSAAFRPGRTSRGPSAKGFLTFHGKRMTCGSHRLRSGERARGAEPFPQRCAPPARAPSKGIIMAVIANTYLTFSAVGNRE